MKIEINDAKFDELALELKIKPTELVKLLVKHFKNIPVQAKNEVIHGKPLEKQLEGILDLALPGLVLNDVIRNIVGEHEYVIDDGDYDLESGIIWLDISFLEGTILNIGTLKLQFGKDAGIVAFEYMEDYPKGLNIDEIARMAEEKLDDTDPVFDVDHGDFIELEDDGESICITLQINWKETLNLPRAAEIDVMMKKIKNLILNSKITKV